MNDQREIKYSEAISAQFKASARPTLTIDVARYEKFLEGSGMSEEARQEFLESMWNVIVAFVELGYGVHPLQEACGKQDEVLDCCGGTDSNGRRSNTEQEERRGPDIRPRRGLESG